MSFRAKRILIIGASSGIGWELAKQLADMGALVGVAARRVDRLELLCQEVSAKGGTAEAFACDVRDDASIRSCVQAMLGKFGGLDILICNAGFGVRGPFLQLATGDFRKQFATNVFGVLECIYAALDALKESRGQVVVTGSVMSYISAPGAIPYAMSKAAIRSLCDGLYHELGREGVAVTLLSPGFVASEIRQIDNNGNFQRDLPDGVPQRIIVPTEKAVREMVRAIAQRRREAIITGHGKFLVSFRQHFPAIFHALMRATGYKRHSDEAIPLAKSSN